MLPLSKGNAPLPSSYSQKRPEANSASSPHLGVSRYRGGEKKDIPILLSSLLASSSSDGVGV